jgi:hypothetical protein
VVAGCSFAEWKAGGFPIGGGGRSHSPTTPGAFASGFLIIGLATCAYCVDRAILFQDPPDDISKESQDGKKDDDL